jgi:SAM-dependent methyltransferase
MPVVMNLRALATRLVNIPFVWNAAQNIVGANPWKAQVYPSVFGDKGSLLDFGCSIGNSTGWFLDFEYLGVDIDASSIAAARHRWRDHPNVRFESRDVVRQPIEQTFDHVLFACTAHHLQDTELEPTIDALMRCLKPAGKLHFFDVIRQPGRDAFTTRLIMNHDQGKHMRTREEYERLFRDGKHRVIQHRVFTSPDRWIKLQDMVYYELSPGPRTPQPGA